MRFRDALTHEARALGMLRTGARRAWEGLLTARREFVTAERDRGLRAAELARVEVL